MPIASSGIATKPVNGSELSLLTTATCSAAGAGVTSGFGRLQGLVRPFAALRVGAFRSLFGGGFVATGGDVLTAGGAATAGAAADRQGGARGAEHESGHQKERECKSRLHEGSLPCVEVRSRTLGLSDRLD